MKETKRECEWIVYKNEKRGKMKAMGKKSYGREEEMSGRQKIQKSR